MGAFAGRIFAEDIVDSQDELQRPDSAGGRLAGQRRAGEHQQAGQTDGDLSSHGQNAGRVQLVCGTYCTTKRAFA